MTAEARVLIWETEHKGWRLPAGGYTTNRAEAGRFTWSEATEICLKANFSFSENGVPNESIVIVPVDERLDDSSRNPSRNPAESETVKSSKN